MSKYIDTAINKYLIQNKIILILSFITVFIVAGLIYVSSYRHKSATFDEGVIIYSGINLLKTGDTTVNAENPALGKALLTLPLLFTDTDVPEPPEDVSYSYQMGAGFDISRKFLYSLNDADSILFRCRLMNVILAFICAFFVYLLLRLFMRHILAFSGMIIFLLSPTVTANARLATVDIAVSMFIVGSVYFLLKALRSKETGWVFLSGLMVSGAMLSKFTGILLLPIIMLQLTAYCLHKRNKASLRTASKFFAIIIIMVLILINSIYMFKGTYHSLAQCNIRSPMLAGIASIPFVKNIPITLPLSYIKGFDIVAYNNQPGFPNIFMGKYYPEGGSWWYYYLMVSVLKIPIPLLVLVITGIIFSTRRFFRRWEYYFILIPPLFIFLNFSFIAYRQLGIRYILPVFPFMVISATFAIRYMLRFKKAKLQLPLLLLIVWLILDNLMIYPHYLAYFNPLSGGSKSGKKYFVSSNLDWGQDLPGLRKWLNERNNPPIYLFYFGQADPEYYDIKYSNKPEYIAVSATYMYLYKANKGLPTRIRKYLDALLKTEPVDNIGYSIYIYKALK